MKTKFNVTGTVKAGVRKSAAVISATSHVLTFGLFAVFITTLMFVAPAKQVVEMIPAQPGSGNVCMPSSANNYCAPENDIRVSEKVAELQAQGMVCSPGQRLAEVIVFQFKDDLHVEAVSFDEALSLGKDNRGWVQSYCD